MEFRSPAVELVPLLRAAMARGYKSSPADIAHRIADDSKFLAMLQDMPKTRLLPDGRRVLRAPETSWWLIGDHTFYGNLNLRHELTIETACTGGHIGYAVHPDFYGQGIGTRLLQYGLTEARRLGLAKVLITIDDGNLASARIAEKCGAVLQDTIAHPHKPGTLHRRYWITL